MEEYKGAPALDAGLLAVSQALEHYEISRFCTMNTWASELGRDEAVSLLNLALGKGHRRDSDAESTVLSGALAINAGLLVPSSRAALVRNLARRRYGSSRKHFSGLVRKKPDAAQRRHDGGDRRPPGYCRALQNAQTSGPKGLNQTLAKN